VTIVLLLAGCTPAFTAPAAPDVHIDVGRIDFVDIEIELERVPQDNCGGNESLRNDVTRSYTVYRELQVTGSAEVGGSVDVSGNIVVAGATVGLGTKLATELGFTYGQAETVSRNVSVGSLPGTRMVHFVSHQIEWSAGTAAIVVNGRRIEVPYRIQRSYKLMPVGSVQLPCDGSDIKVAASRIPWPLDSRTQFVPLDIAAVDVSLQGTAISVNAPVVASGGAGEEPPSPPIPSSTPTSAPPTATSVPSSPTELLPTETPTSIWTPTQVPPTPVPPTPVPPTPIPPPIVCSFSAGPTFAGFYTTMADALGCARSPQITVNTISEQMFQGGHLFWRKDEDVVYIVYDRQIGGGELFQGSWERSIDNRIGRFWSWAAAGEPEPDGIGLMPPPGLWEPLRGFGWLWRTHLGRENGSLGWGLDKAYGFDNVAHAQAFERGVMFRGSDPKVYVLLDNGQFYAVR
jgi:hypothetical protein